METRVLAIFAKAPIAGAVKTRLAQATSADFAAQAAAAFLADTLQRFGNVPATHWLVHAPDEWPAELPVPAEWRLRPQGAGDLGERMRRFVDAQQLAPGHAPGAQYPKIVILGADSPTLPVEYVLQAFERLSAHDVVLGPATDGGYYLLGLARRCPQIFENISWGTSSVLQQTIARLEPELSLALLPPWYDIDMLDDWRLLQGHLAALRRAAMDVQLPHITALIESGAEAQAAQ